MSTSVLGPLIFTSCSTSMILGKKSSSMGVNGFFKGKCSHFTFSSEYDLTDVSLKAVFLHKIHEGLSYMEPPFAFVCSGT